MVKYNAEQEITNTYQNLQIVQSQFFTDKLIFIKFGIIQISIGLSVFRFDYGDKWQIGIRSFLNFWKIRTHIWYSNLKLKYNLSQLPIHDSCN